MIEPMSNMTSSTPSPRKVTDPPRTNAQTPRDGVEDDNTSDEEVEDLSVEQLQQIDAEAGASDKVAAWIQTYEVERQRFASFAVLTEFKLDEVRDSYVHLVGRPNAVEAAACCATLLKMPGIVGCYKSLLAKVSAGIQSAVYLPSPTDDESTSPLPAMSTLVRSLYERKPYFERVRELEKQLVANRCVSDPVVLQHLSADEVALMLQAVPFPRLRAGIERVSAKNDVLSEKMLQLLLNQREQRSSTQPRHHVPDQNESVEYPARVPLATSPQICRAIAQHAAAFSASGRDMILCSILEFIDPESFRDVYKRFDTHAKTGFLHHLSIAETGDQLQLIAEDLPNAGETLFRLYFATCTGPHAESNGGASGAAPSAKHVFFKRVLGPETEFFFLCDLAAYVSDEQWQLLSKQFDKIQQERRRNRRRRRSALMGEDFDEDEEDEDDEDGAKKSAASALDQFQLMLWNYIHHHRLASVQLLPICNATFIPVFGEPELASVIRSCLDRLSIEARWRQIMASIELIDKETKANANVTTVNSEVYQQIHATRLKVMKKLLTMFSHKERDEWLDKVNAKHPTDAYKRRLTEAMEAVQSDIPPAGTVQPDASPPLSLDDPKPHIASMSMDVKMRWIENLLSAITTDREYSARMTMLRQVLHPFMDGKASAFGSTAKPTLASAEKNIAHVLQQLTAADKSKLLAKLSPPPPDNSPITVDRASSPLLEVQEFKLTHPDIPVPPNISVIQQHADRGSTPQSPRAKAPVLEALNALIQKHSEPFVLQLLRDSLAGGNRPVSTKVDDDTIEATPVEGDSAPAIRVGVRRKLSAVLAVAEPMEWQEGVPVGCVSVSVQTDPESDDGEPLSSEFGEPVKHVKLQPLTLSALIGKPPGSTKKKDRFQKINSSAVPRSVAALITSWRMNTDQLGQFAKKSLPAVLRIIADAFGELLTAGRRKTVQPTYLSRGQRELTLSQLVYQSFLHSYGLPAIADMHLLAFSCAIEMYRTQHLRVEYFARFCFEEVGRQDLANYTELLESVVCDDLNTGGAGAGVSTPSSGATAAKRARFVPRIAVPDKENWMISVDKAQEAVQLCFRAMRKPDVAAFCDKVAFIAAQGTSSASLQLVESVPDPAAVSSTVAASGGDAMINVDHLLQLAVQEWQSEQMRREHFLLNAFRAGDVNGDGQLTSAEFSQIVLSIDRSRDLGDILLMYSDTLRRTQCDQIDTDIFLQVAKDYELDRVVWNDDGDLRNVVNDLGELETTWATVRGFFLGTLESLARDLPLSHFLRVCEGAGCGCLKCILDGYIGFQKMRRDYVGRRSQPSPLAVSPALVWARFWHLMRQLHDAAAESDGIATPWDGFTGVLRSSPAPTPAPRYVSRRRDALPIYLLPDPNRITGVMSSVHNPEVFEVDAINAQFAETLLARMSFKSDGSSGS